MLLPRRISHCWLVWPDSDWPDFLGAVPEPVRCEAIALMREDGLADLADECERFAREAERAPVEQLTGI